MEENNERVEIYKQYRKQYGIYVDPSYKNREYIDKRKEKNPSPSKISGNIFAYIIKNKIKGILKEFKDKEYHVSDNNSYIAGCFTEWDLLICHGREKDHKESNIYDPKDVICAIELKSGGLVGYGTIKGGSNYIGDYFDKAAEVLEKKQNKNIKYIYISLYDSDVKKDIIEKIKKDNNDKEFYKNRFYSYFVTTNSWSYNKFADKNDTAADIDTGATLEDIIKDIIEKTNN